MFSSQNYISDNEVNLANYAHACFDKAIAEIVSKAIITTLLLQLIMNKLILLEVTLLDGKIFTLLRPEDMDLLNQVEKLSTCESKLINKIKNLNYLENNENHHIMNKKKIVPSNRVSFNKISSFMINWSNKFVVIALLTISAIALSKQAWA